jgi:hypothetical protein
VPGDVEVRLAAIPGSTARPLVLPQSGPRVAAGQLLALPLQGERVVLLVAVLAPPSSLAVLAGQRPRPETSGPVVALLVRTATVVLAVTPMGPVQAAAAAVMAAARLAVVRSLRLAARAAITLFPQEAARQSRRRWQVMPVRQAAAAPVPGQRPTWPVELVATVPSGMPRMAQAARTARVDTIRRLRARVAMVAQPASMVPEVVRPFTAQRSMALQAQALPASSA